MKIEITHEETGACKFERARVCVRVCVNKCGFVACLLYKVFSKKLRIDKTDVFPKYIRFFFLEKKISFKNKTEQIL